MKKIDTKTVVVSVVLSAILIFFVFFFGKNSGISEISCSADTDCACGTHLKTGECFYGNKAYVDEKKQCPDFCSGIAGNYVVKCVNNECRKVSR